MTDDEVTRLTFSQREGKVPLPEPMKLEHVSCRFKQLVWKYIDSAFFVYCENEEYQGYGYVGGYDGYVCNLLYSYRFDVLLLSHDRIRDPTTYSHPDEDRELVRQTLLDGEYHVVLSFVEYVLRDVRCPNNLRTSLTAVFDKTPIAYFVDGIAESSTIMPRSSLEAGEAVQRAIETLRDASMHGASTHLRQAAEHINGRQYADSVADSIHAVESVARVIDPGSSKTLGPALNSLQDARLLKHPALKAAFGNLYGYANTEQGIRHALIDQAAADVGLDEAMFMFGACASFAAYLANKHRQAGDQGPDRP